MKIEQSTVTKLYLTDLDRLDPVTVYLEDFLPGQGKITIECFGESWSSYWPAMGGTIAQFFVSCDEHYLAKNLSRIDAEIYDLDAIRDAANENHIECVRDDPWNDLEFLTEMYGPDPADWHDSLPKMKNPGYEYLCRIIKTVQQGLNKAA